MSAFERAARAYETGRLYRAARLCGEALAERPEAAEPAHLLGLVSFRLGRPRDALPLLERAARAAPGNALFRTNLALPLRALERHAEAVHHLREALRLQSGFPPALDLLAATLISANRAAEAVPVLEQILDREPGNVAQWVSLALTLRNLGETGRAAECCARALALDGASSAAWWVQASLRTWTESDNHLADMQRLIAGGALPHDAQVPLCFALAKECEDLARYDEAFAWLEQGNRMKRATLRYDGAVERALFARIREVFARERFATAGRDDTRGEGCVFVVGMPRSGSTLVEQILAAHPAVSAAGELPTLPRLAAEHCVRAGGAFPEACGAMTDEALAALGDEYLAISRGYGGDTPYLVDKMPVNFLNLGLIHLALPAARIVHVRRGALDTCVSCYAQLFGGLHRYAYDLRELGEYYRLYESLMAHWSDVLPGRVLSVEYERLVADPEAETRRLLAHCGLPWDAACSDFRSVPRGVRTPSAVQVREPVHRRSVARWQRFEGHLEPLRAALEATRA